MLKKIIAVLIVGMLAISVTGYADDQPWGACPDDCYQLIIKNETLLDIKTHVLAAEGDKGPLASQQIYQDFDAGDGRTIEPGGKLSHNEHAIFFKIQLKYGDGPTIGSIKGLLGAIKVFGSPLTHDIKLGYTSEEPGVKDECVLSDVRSCKVITVRYRNAPKIAVTIDNKTGQALKLLNQKPKDGYSKQPPQSIPGQQSANFDYSAKKTGDAQVAYGASKKTYCALNYGWKDTYSSDFCKASAKAHNEKDPNIDRVDCSVTHHKFYPSGNLCEITLSVSGGRINPPKAINVKLQNKLYTGIQRDKYNPSGSSHYKDGKLPPKSLPASDGKPQTDEFSYKLPPSEKVKSNNKFTEEGKKSSPGGGGGVTYYPKGDKSVQCTLSYHWDEANFCTASVVNDSPGDNIQCKVISPKRTQKSCDTGLIIQYKNPPAVNITVNNISNKKLKLGNVTPSKDDYKPQPKSKIAAKGSASFTYNVPAAPQKPSPSVRYYPEGNKSSYCKISFNNYGVDGCSITATSVLGSSSSGKGLTCGANATGSSASDCRGIVTIDEQPLSAPSAIKMTVKNKVFDDIVPIDAKVGHATFKTVENGQSTSPPITYKRGLGQTGYHQVVKYKLAHDEDAICAFKFGWNPTKQCFVDAAQIDPQTGKPVTKGEQSKLSTVLNCQGNVTVIRDKDNNCSMEFIVGMPNK